ncbi:MAG: DUF885 family protein [Desulfobacterales bacterium]|nr:MAG: DUF885 family protein [Desulfobacterales bacterium]
MAATHKDTHIEIAKRYFNYLAERFPVMCASDEFHFLPRAENARNHYGTLDNLDADAISETLVQLKKFQNELAAIRGAEDDLEKYLEIELLNANIAGFLIEFEQKRSWQYNPLLYLKIAFIGLDHAQNKPSDDFDETTERTIARLTEIPRILNQGMNNIDSVPEDYYQASLHMIDDCQQYLDATNMNLSEFLSKASLAAFSRKLENVALSLDSFKTLLSALTPVSDQQFGIDTLEATLKNHFLSARSLDEIFQIAVNDWEKNLRRLEQLRSKLDPGKTWQALYHHYFPSGVGGANTVSLYAQEIKKLRSFFLAQGFNDKALNAPVEVSATPIYLRSVRAAASFAAAFTSDIREKSFFYITTRFPRQKSDHADTLLKKRIHREYKPLTAHETIPGHHFLDSIRRQLQNPIRRQIESPLFYEGWASYSESLLSEYGYMNDAMDRLVDLKRNLWRSARCQIDAGLTAGRITETEAMELLQTCSFSAPEARRQIDRFRLNPGYQVCYSLGSYEFKQLRAKYGPKMDPKRFYECLLDGGELPFHLLDLRLKNLIED